MAENDNERGEQRWERETLERLAFAAIKEQRRARRWGIFFKLLFAGILIAVLWLIYAGRYGETALSGRYTALVDLDGVIDASSPASADNIIDSLDAAFEDKGTVGVVLRANSPGGSPVQSAYINDEIRRLRAKHPKIPIYAVVTDMCASGCYYAIAASNKIYASPASIVGSIGVLMDGFGFVGTMKKLGVERRLLTAGRNKGMLDPFSPLDPKQKRYVLDMLEDIHQQFIDTVKRGRGAALKDDKDLFSGLFWTGDQAKRLGLVDDFGSLEHVARDVIGAGDIVDFTVRPNLFDRFAERVGGTMANSLAARFSSPQLELR